MKNRIHLIVFILCIIASILLVVGGSLTLKELKEREQGIINNPDNKNNLYLSFDLNGASSIDQKRVSCEIVDGGCSVILPNAIRNDGIVLGYSENKDDLDAMYKVNSTINLTENKKLYVISYKENNLLIEDSHVDYIDSSNLSCKMYNLNNDCVVIIPRFNKNGFENKGYSASQDSLTGYIYPGSEYKLSKDEKIYPIYGTTSRHQSINIEKVIDNGSSYIEIEYGCDSSVYNEYLKYLDEISKKTPFLFIGSKITFVVDRSFDEIWGNSYVGMNYGPRGLRSVDVRCSKSVFNDYYATMVHEMAHTWDFYYANRMGSNISSQSDIINLYNKYQNASNRPFRDYSYSSIYEFIADMMRYYYFKYYVPTASFKNLPYPDDLKKTMEKYICISKNNYDETGCV